jgi:hypothetical protein
MKNGTIVRIVNDSIMNGKIGKVVGKRGGGRIHVFVFPNYGAYHFNPKDLKKVTNKEYLKEYFKMNKAKQMAIKR